MNNPSIKKLDEYIGVYYQDKVEQKIKATHQILCLFQDFTNLEALLQHQSLLPLLSRTLSENHKRSIDLSVYILSIFYILSYYRQLQTHLTDNQVGKAIIDVMENQLQRFDLLYSEYIQLWRKNQQKDRITAKAQLKKLNILIWKQDKLFFICLNILLNLTENPTTEKKMKKAGITNILIRCLERNDFHLLIVSLIFLRKLSIVAQYKDQALAMNIVQKLQRFFTCQNDVLLNSALFLYYNLAFDRSARESIQKASLIPKLVVLIEKDSPNRMLALNILYLLSTDTGIRFTLAYTNCMNFVMNMILYPNPNIGTIELIALALNLTANDRNVEHISEEDFHKIMERAIKSEDPTLLKLCKNILKSSKNEEMHKIVGGFIKDKVIKMVMTKSKNQQLCLELIGVGWSQILIANPKFIEFISNAIINGVTDDDLLLQIVMLVSNICQSRQSCVLVQKQLFQPILSLFLGKQYDPQFLTQILYSIYAFIFYGIGLERLLSEGQALMLILQLIDDPNQGVRQMNDEILTILRETDDIELIEDIKKSKFERHNKKWLTETEGLHKWVFQQNDELNDRMLDPRMWESEDDYD